MNNLITKYCISATRTQDYKDNLENILYKTFFNIKEKLKSFIKEKNITNQELYNNNFNYKWLCVFSSIEINICNNKYLIQLDFHTYKYDKADDTLLHTLYFSQQDFNMLESYSEKMLNDAINNLTKSIDDISINNRNLLISEIERLKHKLVALE